MDEEDKKPETYPEVFDKLRGVGIASGLPPSDVKYGPLRNPPTFYAGEMRLKKKRVIDDAGVEKIDSTPVYRKDVERHPNGAVVGVRSKLMRRIVRSKLKQRASSVEKGRHLVQQMKVQTRDVARADNKSAKWADRLLEKELDIHTPPHVPTKKELRAQRTARRAAQRRGELGDPVNDAIAQLVDAQKKDKP